MLKLVRKQQTQALLPLLWFFAAALHAQVDTGAGGPASG